MLTSISDTRSSQNEEPHLLLWWVVAQMHHSQNGVLNIVQVAGESGLGKTTFINTLFSTTIKNYADHKRRHAKQVDKTVEIEITKAELEEKFFKGTPYKLKCNAISV
jgi:septin family protein